MRNEQFLILLADTLPDGNHIFDKVWEQSAIAAICLLIAVALGVICYFQQKELRAERKARREEIDKKDESIEKLNILFREQWNNAITTTQGLVNRMEEGNQLTEELRDEVVDLNKSMKNGLRALGSAAGIPAERLKVD